MDAEKQLIARVLFKEELRPVIDRKVHEGMFVDRKSKEAFGFLMGFYEKYSELPSIDLIEEKFPDLKLTYAKEPADYYIDEIMENHVRNKGSKLLMSYAGEFIKNPRQGLTGLTEQLLELGIETEPVEDMNYGEELEKRKERYLDIKDGKIYGYSSPWDALDDVTLGWHKGDFIAVVGRPGVGKTWGALVLAEHAWREGNRVMFVTMEMGIAQIAQRFDALHYRLPYQEFRSGLLPDNLEKQYLESEIKRENPFWIVRNVGGVAALGSKIDQYSPDVVILDGMYLLNDDYGGKNMWERVTNVSKSMKKLAQKKDVPIIATTQFNRATDERRMDMVTLANIGFSDSLGQDSDVVLGLFRDRDMELNNEMLVRILKCREGESVDFVLSWDLHEMAFDVLRRVEENEEVADEEEEELTFDESALDF